jgi:hypothetical protein
MSNRDKPSNYEEEEEYIFTQYALTLINDGMWYTMTRRSVANKNYGEFRKVTHKFINALMRSNNDVSSRSDHSVDTHFIEYLIRRTYFMLWQHEGAPETSSDIYISDRTTLNTLAARSGHTAPPITLTSTIESKPIMSSNASIPFQSVNYVYGQDVKALEPKDLINSIKRVEKEIADLKTVQTSSTKITSMIEGLTTMKDQMVAALDAS